MAYQEVLAPASAAAIVDAIRSFAAANGWTVERNNLAGSLRTVTLSRAGLDYIHVYNPTTTDIRLVGSIDYNSGVAPESTTRRSRNALSTLLNAGPYTRMFLFADSSPTPHIHVVIELATAGVYRHLSFGMLEKWEPFTGGTYGAASDWHPSGNAIAVGYNSNNHGLFGSDRHAFGSGTTAGASDFIRCDFAADSHTDAWFYISNDVGARSARSGISGNVLNLRPLVESCDDNVFSNRSIFHPTDVMVNRVGNYWSRIGRFPNVRFCSTAKFAPGDEITISSDVWKVFPMVRKFSLALAGESNPAHSNNFAYAYKKVP